MRHQQRSGCQDEVDLLIRTELVAAQRRANNAERQRNRRLHLRGLGVPILDEPRMAHDRSHGG
jgi:hypothetical protein